MNRSRWLLAAGLLALAPASLSAWPQPGTEAPNFSLPDTAYVIHQLNDYRGKVVQLMFWQST